MAELYFKATVVTALRAMDPEIVFLHVEISECENDFTDNGSRKSVYTRIDKQM